MAETLAQQKARQRANSLAEQRQKFLKTGRATKGLVRAGEAVEAQSYVIQRGDSPFSVARKILGPNASESMVAAFVQQQGWLDSFTTGDTLDIAGAYISPNARPTTDFMLAANAQSASIGADVGFRNLGITNVGGQTSGQQVSSGALTSEGLNQYQQSERTQVQPQNAWQQLATQVQGANALQGMSSAAARYADAGANINQRGSAAGSAIRSSTPARATQGDATSALLRSLSPIGQAANAAASVLESTNVALGGTPGALASGGVPLPTSASTTSPQTQQSTALSSAVNTYQNAIQLALDTGNRSYLPAAGSSTVWGEIVASSPEWQQVLADAGLEVSGIGLGQYLGYDVENFDPTINGYPRLDAASTSYSNQDLRKLINDYRYHPTKPFGTRFVRARGRSRADASPPNSQSDEGVLSNSGGYGPNMMASWNVDF